MVLVRKSNKGRITMKSDSTSLLQKNWTAAGLWKLPAAQRDAILEAAAALTETLYRNDPQLTDFEAFDDEDLYGESTAARGVKSGRCSSAPHWEQRYVRSDRRWW